VPNVHKARFIHTLTERFGALKKLAGSQSLFTLGEDAARIYIRYSKVHEGGGTFFGLRDVDLGLLEGHNAFICFLTDDDSAPVLIPYADFEEVFRASQPASDGQYKAQLIAEHETRELYIARQGRFNVEGYVGIDGLAGSLDAKRLRQASHFSHCQVQTLLAGIGHVKGPDVWVPESDVCRLDWLLTGRFALRNSIPAGFEDVRSILAEIDVVWVSSGRNEVEGLFEVEHSTPIYSGLLRFNDVLLTNPKVSRFSIVSNDTRRTVFSRQLFRPTFRRSGLTDLVSFLEYGNVLDWHARLSGRR
jgi:hypothetical protein